MSPIYYMEALKEYLKSKFKKSEADERSGYKYKDPRTGEIFIFERKGVYRKNGRILVPVRGSELEDTDKE